MLRLLNSTLHLCFTMERLLMVCAKNTGYTVIIWKSYIAEKARIAHSGLKGLSISTKFAQRRVFREERAFKVVSVLWCSSCEG